MIFKKKIFQIISALYFTSLIYIVFFIRRRFNKIDYKTKLNLIPFKEKYDVINQLNIEIIQFQKNFFIEIVGNIVMFIPLCYAIIWLFNTKISTRKFIVLIIVSSVLIEFLQFILNKGVLDIDDVILNTIGGIIGVVLQKNNYRIKKF